MTCPICQHVNRPTAHFCAQCRAPFVLQGKYRITRLLGRGGYGAVYQAEHTGLGGALYAIKELLPDPNAAPAPSQAASEQFRLEASLLAKLNHPALPKVMDCFAEGNRDYLVMEYVEGETLEERLARNNGPLPEAQVCAWLNELCDVLTYLHTRQPSPVIHRDLKPSNIKLASDGRLKLIDFGIAKFLALGVGTATAARAVSPPYSPIEQYGRGTDVRSDIYALGVTLYELLTCHLPPEAPDRASESLVPPRQWNPALSPTMETVMLKAMAEKPGERFQSAAEIKQALTPPAPPPQAVTRAYTQPIKAPLVSSKAATTPKSKSDTAGWLIGGLVVFGIVVFSLNQPPQEPALATATVEANATAAAQATPQGVRTVVTSMNQMATRSFGPTDGTLDHGDSDSIPYSSASGTFLNFIAEIKFYNPYSRSEKAWDYGIDFRSTNGNEQYRLSMDSDAVWRFILINGTAKDGVTPKTKSLGAGYVPDMDLAAGGSNTLRLAVRDQVAYFFVNDLYIGTLDTSERNVSGTIWVGTGMTPGHQIKGRSTRYEGFTVWSLP